MGLDMYAYATEEALPAPVDFKTDELGSKTELHYWRKHPNLHGWMERLYREKGGTSADFNCDAVQIIAADLDRLEADLAGRNLPATTGFFFGSSDGREADDDLRFIAKAREQLSVGKSVFYTSWW